MSSLSCMRKVIQSLLSKAAIVVTGVASWYKCYTKLQSYKLPTVNELGTANTHQTAKI